MKKTSIIPIPVNKALKKLGADLKEARIKRRLTMALVEERAGITHVTLTKVEKGDSSVSIGIYAKVIFVLGLIDNLYQLAEPDNDIIGKMYDKENLPKRVRYKKDEG
ncbi:MAG: helix-turn-helix domain-containing protein [Alphaproteobacteria bacterium]|nr:helix-turn-helix domain-containing protein [Alphaproteobacteria bacterium]